MDSLRLLERSLMASLLCSVTTCMAQWIEYTMSIVKYCTKKKNNLAAVFSLALKLVFRTCMEPRGRHDEDVNIDLNSLPLACMIWNVLQLTSCLGLMSVIHVVEKHCDVCSSDLKKSKTQLGINVETRLALHDDRYRLTWSYCKHPKTA